MRRRLNRKIGEIGKERFGPFPLFPAFLFND